MIEWCWGGGGNKEEQATEQQAESRESLQHDYTSMGITSSAVFKQLGRELEHSEAGTDEAQNLPRDQWNRKCDFLMACLSTAVGLGNIWRFPFTAYENGGGAFLIPYIVVLVFIGHPLYFLELTMGQFSNSGAVKVWNAVPMMRGVGYAQCLISGVTASYYLSILGICAYYLCNSFSDPLPWSHCDKANYVTEGREVFKNLTCTNNMTGGGAEYTCPAGSGGSEPKVKLVSSPELYYNFAVLQAFDDVTFGIGTPIWYLALTYLLSWILVFGNVCLGAKSVGKAAYFTALFPYAVLFTLFGQALTLEGSGTGLSFFFRPQFSKLLELQVWFRAIGQCFFSMGIGYGNVIAYGSYNGFNDSLLFESFFIAMMDALTSILAGSTVFAALGALAHAKKVPMSEVIRGGPGLAFISYPDLLLTFQKEAKGLAQALSVLFFLMFLTLGVGSGGAYISTVGCAILDKFPKWNKSAWKKMAVFAGVCIPLYLIGLVFVTNGGTQMLDLVDQYASNLTVLVIVCAETIGVCYIYGMKNFVQDLRFMLFRQRPKSSYGVKCFCAVFRFWGYAAPAVMIVACVYQTTLAITHPLGQVSFVCEGRAFPVLGLVFGWVMYTGILLVIPAFAVKVLLTRKSHRWSTKLRAGLYPSRRWGPADPEDRAAWHIYKANLKPTTWLHDRTIGKLFPSKPISSTNID